VNVEETFASRAVGRAGDLDWDGIRPVVDYADMILGTQLITNVNSQIMGDGMSNWSGVEGETEVRGGRRSRGFILQGDHGLALSTTRSREWGHTTHLDSDPLRDERRRCSGTPHTWAVQILRRDERGVDALQPVLLRDGWAIDRIDVSIERREERVPRRWGCA
jgi:hypothetical protein